MAALLRHCYYTASVAAVSIVVLILNAIFRRETDKFQAMEDHTPRIRREEEGGELLYIQCTVQYIVTLEDVTDPPRVSLESFWAMMEAEYSDLGELLEVLRTIQLRVEYARNANMPALDVRYNFMLQGPPGTGYNFVLIDGNSWPGLTYSLCFVCLQENYHRKKSTWTFLLRPECYSFTRCGVEEERRSTGDARRTDGT